MLQRFDSLWNWIDYPQFMGGEHRLQEAAPSRVLIWIQTLLIPHCMFFPGSCYLLMHLSNGEQENCSRFSSCDIWSSGLDQPLPGESTGGYCRQLWEVGLLLGVSFSSLDLSLISGYSLTLYCLPWLFDFFPASQQNFIFARFELKLVRPYWWQLFISHIYFHLDLVFWISSINLRHV